MVLYLGQSGEKVVCAYAYRGERRPDVQSGLRGAPSFIKVCFFKSYRKRLLRFCKSGYKSGIYAARKKRTDGNVAFKMRITESRVTLKTLSDARRMLFSAGDLPTG